MQHGGSRRGAGRKARQIRKTVASPPPVRAASQTPEEYLASVINDPEVERQSRMDAAELLMRYGRGGGRGKKALLEEAAKDATRGRFATPATPPTLVVSNGR